jgi:hypothetical protein
VRRFARASGWTAVALSVLLGLLGVASLPDGGLMFALPYVFLIPAAFLAVVGAGLLVLGRPPRDADD